MVMVDDSHATGFMGASGRGTHEHCGVMGRVDILTGTLGKALGGAQRRLLVRRARRSSTGCASARGPTCSRTRSPPVVAARRSRCSTCSRARRRCATGSRENAAYFRARDDGARLHAAAGRAPDHPGDARRRRARRRAWPTGCSSTASTSIGFSYPGRAAGQGAHPHADVARRTTRDAARHGAIAAFAQVGPRARRHQ